MNSENCLKGVDPDQYLKCNLRFQIQVSGSECIQCTLCVFDPIAFTDISFFIHCGNIYATFMYIQSNIDSNHLLDGTWEFKVGDISTAFYSPLFQGTMSRRRAANLKVDLTGQQTLQLPLRLSRLHRHAGVDRKTFFMTS